MPKTRKKDDYKVSEIVRRVSEIIRRVSEIVRRVEIENFKDMMSLKNVPKDGFKRNLGGSNFCRESL